MRFLSILLLGVACFGVEASAQVAALPKPAAVHGLKPILVDGFRVEKRQRAHHHHRRSEFGTRYLYPPTYNFEGRSYFYFPRDGGRKDEPTMAVVEERWR